MHKLLGEHEFIEVFNHVLYEAEQICTVCMFVKNTKPVNTENADQLVDAFRYGMISASDALDAMGLPGEVDLDIISKKTH